MRTQPARAVQLARELEAALEEYPDDRAQILTESAEFWYRAGEHDRAIELLTEAISLGGEGGGNARATLAEVLFDLGHDGEAQAQLDALRKDRPPSPLPYHLAAELLEERAAHQEALTWFNMAVSRLSDEEMTDRNHERGFSSYADHVIAGRRRVRRKLGLPPDELDGSVPESGHPPAGSVEDLAARLAQGPQPRELRVLFWPRDEIAHAHRRWPQIVQHTDIDIFVRERESANRELSEAGIAQITMVPLTAAKLAEFADRTGGDPADADTRLACLDEIVAEGGAISWPPARNAPCWCGSSVKYKKCCGRSDPT